MGYFYQWEGIKYIFDMDDFSYSEAFSVSSAGRDRMKDAAIKYIKEINQYSQPLFGIILIRPDTRFVGILMII